MKRAILYLTVALLLVGCNEKPYQKGKKLAAKYDACMTDYYEALEQVGEDFAVKIKGNYNSREKVIEDYLDQLRDCHQEYLEKWNNIAAEEQHVCKKIKSSAERTEFENGLQNDREFYAFASVPDIETISIHPAVLQQIHTIIPPKPDETQIAHDLEGHTVSEGKENGYYPQSWTWKIMEDGVSDLKIVSIQESTSSRYSVVVSMLLSSETRAYDTKATVSYILDGINDWQIEYVRSMGMNIVKTHRYDDCLKCYLEREVWSSYKNLYAENNCDIALEVAGKVLCAYNDTWENFYYVVPPHETAQIYRYAAKDFKIDYIERP